MIYTLNNNLMEAKKVSYNKNSNNDSIAHPSNTDVIISKKNNNKLLPWSEKYRPNEIKNILYHDKIVKAITNYMLVNKLPHLLFYGPPGSGKTSLITAIARHYYKEDYDNMILILNASEERGIETVRNRIKQFVITKGLCENKKTPAFKLIILDEIDAMTDDAQAILRKVIEKYVSNVRFCFICNYLKKINPAIQSRCVIFRFNPIPSDIISDYVVDICSKENIKITSNGLNLIIKKSNGDMRKLLNILQSLYMHNSTEKSYENISNNSDSDKLTSNSDKLTSNYILISEKSVSKILSCPTHKNIKSILKFVQKNNLQKTYYYIQNMIEVNGISLSELINYVYEYCMDCIVNGNIQLINFTEEKIMNIIKNLSIVNKNLTYCNNDNIQLVSFISIFYL
jgi:replication factor C subunit 3/5